MLLPALVACAGVTLGAVFIFGVNERFRLDASENAVQGHGREHDTLKRDIFLD